jgi:adenylate cyclase
VTAPTATPIAASSPLDPAPRRYAPSVTLVRRATRADTVVAEDVAGLEDVEAWLLGDAAAESDTLALVPAFAWRLVAAGFPLDRMSLHAGTLHPQVYGFAWGWARGDGLCDEIRVAEDALQADAYRKSPLAGLIERGEVFDAVPAEVADTYPLMAELAEQGMTEYLGVPLTAFGTFHNAASVATTQPGGFSTQERATILRLLKLFALHVERHIALRIAANLMDTYLGTLAGGRVLTGGIKRGWGAPIRAVIWASDLRGFTTLADRLEGPEVTALLNAYFEALAGAVLDHGGEVLKFIGDGLLAAFPFETEAEGREMAANALTAAQAALAGLARLNAAPPPELAGIAGWRPLRTGIALHDGEVFFGNVGAPARLDFTVIGRAVNEAARIEALTKDLGRDLLISAPVFARLDAELEDLGIHPLRGVAEGMHLFSTT